MLRLSARTRVIMFAGFLTALAGCAHAPDASINYYFARTSIDVRVVRAVTCDEPGNVFYADAPTVTAVHSADTESPVQSVNLRDLNGTFASTTVTVSYYDDGRLKGFNTETTGQGAAVLTSAIKTGAALGAFDAQQDRDRQSLCAILATRDKRTMSFTFEATIDPAEAAPTEPLRGRANAVLASGVNPIPLVNSVLGPIHVYLDPQSAPAPRVEWRSQEAGNYVRLPMRQPQLIRLAVSSDGFSPWAPQGGVTPSPMWEGEVLVATRHGATYSLPMPRAAFFGSRKFQVGLTEVGEISQFSYTNNAGASDIAGLGPMLADVLREPTLAETVASVRGEADLIAQTERLARCRADPTDC